MPELGSLGSVRGALSNGRPYRECIILLVQGRKPTAETPIAKTHDWHVIRLAMRNVRLTSVQHGPTYQVPYFRHLPRLLNTVAQVRGSKTLKGF